MISSRCSSKCGNAEPARTQTRRLLRGGSGFLHFHEDPEGPFADLKLKAGGDFTRFRVATAADANAFSVWRARPRRYEYGSLPHRRSRRGRSPSFIVGEAPSAATSSSCARTAVSTPT